MSEIILSNLSLDYVSHINNRSLKKTVLSMFRSQAKPHPFRALNNINLSLKQGERVGLIGSNGAGKSTFLKVLSGIYYPTFGELTIKGKVTPLLGSSFGLDSELDGIENIFFLATLLGRKKSEIKKKLDDIMEFSGLGEFLFSPARTYSSGMQLRLAFSTLTAFETDILLIDEVINVGDENFASKALKRVENLISNTNIFILATHQESMIQKMCDRVLYLENGNVIFFGSVNEGLELYNANIKNGLNTTEASLTLDQELDITA